MAKKETPKIVSGRVENAVKESSEPSIMYLISAP